MSVYCIYTEATKGKAMLKQSYSDHTGMFQMLADLLGELLPIEGAVPQPRKNKALEKFRKACNAYTDLYNEGLDNRASEFRTVLGIASNKYKRRGWRGKQYVTYFAESLYEEAEAQMNKIVFAAAVEQGIDFFYIEAQIVKKGGTSSYERILWTRYELARILAEMSWLKKLARATK